MRARSCRRFYRCGAKKKKASKVRWVPRCAFAAAVNSRQSRGEKKKKPNKRTNPRVFGLRFSPVESFFFFFVRPKRSTSVSVSGRRFGLVVDVTRSRRPPNVNNAPFRRTFRFGADRPIRQTHSTNNRRDGPRRRGVCAVFVRPTTAAARPRACSALSLAAQCSRERRARSVVADDSCARHRLFRSVFRVPIFFFFFVFSPVFSLFAPSRLCFGFFFSFASSPLAGIVEGPGPRRIVRTRR